MATETTDAFRGANYEIAEAIAPTWERRSPQIEEVATPVREWMLRELQPREGDTVLELAAGVGETGFGYMLMADPAAALAETRRVLRAGGRLALAVWGPPERNPFFGIVALSLIQHGHVPPPEPPPAPGMFSMASPERTTRLLETAGFTEVRTEEVPGRFVLPRVDEYLSVIADTAGPIGLALRALSEADHARFKAEVEDSLSRFAAESGYELPAVALCAVGV